MHYRLEYTAAARKQIKKLPADILSRIIQTIERLTDNPRPEGIKKLTGYREYYRIRVGNYRIIYTIMDEQLIVLVIRVAHRKNVYRRLNPVNLVDLK